MFLRKIFLWDLPQTNEDTLFHRILWNLLHICQHSTTFRIYYCNLVCRLLSFTRCLYRTVIFFRNGLPIVASIIAKKLKISLARIFNIMLLEYDWICLKRNNNTSLRDKRKSSIILWLHHWLVRSHQKSFLYIIKKVQKNKFMTRLLKILCIMIY